MYLTLKIQVMIKTIFLNQKKNQKKKKNYLLVIAVVENKLMI